MNRRDILFFLIIVLLSVGLGLIVLKSVPSNVPKPYGSQYDSIISELKKEKATRDSLYLKVSAIEKSNDSILLLNSKTTANIKIIQSKLINIQSEYAKIKDYSNYDSDSIFMYFKRRNAN